MLIGIESLAEILTKERVRQERAEKREASFCDPGRRIDTSLFSRDIPDHVYSQLATATKKGSKDDRTILFSRLRPIAGSLILREYTGEDLISLLEGTVLGDEVTSRRGKLLEAEQYSPLVLKAYQYAKNYITDRGWIPQEDESEYAQALAKRWLNWIELEQVQVSSDEEIVLLWVLKQMQERNFIKVACTSNSIAEALGKSYKMAGWRALNKVTASGLLIQRSQGTPILGSKDAAMYELPPCIPRGRQR